MEDNVSVRRRWDDDTIGHGIGDAAAARPAVVALLDAMAARDWVAEEPEAHLLPHIRAAAERAGVPIASISIADGILEVGIDATPSRLHPRELALLVVASFAEASTHVREVAPGDFEVVTGMLEGDGAFAPHGHVVRLRIVRGD
jgi:hypothetical protein